MGLEKERLRCGGLDFGRERGVEVDDDLDLGLKREGLRSTVNPHRSPLTPLPTILSTAPSSM